MLRRTARQRHAFGTVGGHGRGEVGDEGLLEQPGIELHRQDPFDRHVDLFRSNAPCGQQRGQIAIGGPVGEIDIDTGIQRVFGSTGHVLGKMVTRHHFLDGEVIGNDRALIAPFLAQHVMQQPDIGVAGDAVDLVITRHHRVDAGAVDHLLERGEELFAQGPFRNLRRTDIGAAFGLSVSRHVLQRGHDLALAQPAVGADTLQALDRGHAHFAHQERIFAERLLDTAPARIARHVHHRR